MSAPDRDPRVVLFDHHFASRLVGALEPDAEAFVHVAATRG
jgi:hypothetical protein